MKMLKLLVLLCLLNSMMYAQTEPKNNDQKLRDSSLPEQRTKIHANGSEDDSISFFMHYLPAHRYEQSISQQMNTTVTYSGPDSMLNHLKDQGVTNPTIIDNNLHMTSTVVTGDFNAMDVMPVKMIFGKSYNAQGKPVILEGTAMIGKAYKDKMPTFDSTILVDPNDASTKAVMDKIKNVFSQIALPKNNMKPGDVYTQNTPVSIPVGPAMMNMVLKTNYKLIAVTDSFANFDITIIAKINMVDNDADTSVHKTGTGSGGGTMVYDRLNGFPVHEDLQSTMEMKVVSENIGIAVKANTVSKHDVTIKKIVITPPRP